MGSDRYKRDNSGGYGNPPVRTQFKPGNKGGPGAKKGDRSIEAQFRKILGSKMTVVDKRTKEARKVDPVEQIALRAIQLGMSGSQKDNERAVMLVKKYGPKPKTEAVTDLSRLTDLELALYGYLCVRVQDAGVPMDDQFAEYIKNVQETLDALEQEGRLVAYWGPIDPPSDEEEEGDQDN